MEIPPEIEFKGFDASDALTARIQELVARLEHIYDRIIRCQVLIETPHRHHRQGRQFHVRIRLTVPGGEIVTSHDPGADETHEDAYVAVRDAFAAARRQLEDYARKPRSDYKRHRVPRIGTIVFLDDSGTWGWLEVENGRRVHFDRAVVAAGLEHLAVGEHVRFVEQDGEALSVDSASGHTQESTAM
ncbi:MAG: cold-shock protein DNA-binding protein [Myxococcales bacterium]|nr:cold-shock protein DNA-binding protein [Myxococcales bacterium]